MIGLPSKIRPMQTSYFELESEVISNNNAVTYPNKSAETPSKTTSSLNMNALACCSNSSKDILPKTKTTYNNQTLNSELDEDVS